MGNTLFTRYTFGTVIVETPEDMVHFEMLSDFVIHCEANGVMPLTLDEKNGRRVIKAGKYVGFIRLTDGTVFEILPYSAKHDKDIMRKLCRIMSEIIDIPFSEADYEEGFMEYFISVFAREGMKIIKSGLLSGYASVEENMNSVQGSILFAENNRRNLVHRERLYVRHDVFTPDRAENRLLKATAKLMLKISGNHKNIQSLKQIVSFLDEVKPSFNTKNDFAQCINTRNTKKYSTVLNICRLFLDKDGYASYSGKYVSCAMFIPAEDVVKRPRKKAVIKNA